MRIELWAMKLVTVLAVSCSRETVPRPPPPPVDWASFTRAPSAPDAGTTSATANERAVADRYVNALASHGVPPSEGQEPTRPSAEAPSEGEIEGLGRLLDEDAHFTFAGFKDVHGRGNVVRAHAALFGSFTNRTFVTRRVLLAKSSQSVEWTMIGAHGKVRKPVVIPGITLLWTKDDGLITDVHVFFDETRVNAESGVGLKALADLPPPELPPGPRRQFEQKHSAEEAANLELVQSMLDALENGGQERYLAALSDDVELAIPRSSGPARGKAAARAYFESIHTAIADLDSQLDNGWAAGPFVVVEYHVVGEQRGPIGPILPEHNLIKMFMVDVVELRNGKVMRIDHYDNPAQILSMPENLK